MVGQQVGYFGQGIGLRQVLGALVELDIARATVTPVAAGMRMAKRLKVILSIERERPAVCQSGFFLPSVIVAILMAGAS